MGLGWAGLGWAGLGWAGLGWAGLGWAYQYVLIMQRSKVQAKKKPDTLGSVSGWVAGWGLAGENHLAFRNQLAHDLGFQFAACFRRVGVVFLAGLSAGGRECILQTGIEVVERD